MFDLDIMYSNTIENFTPPAWWRPFREFERKDSYFWHSFKFLHRLTPRPHVSVFAWKRRFFPSVWPRVFGGNGHRKHIFSKTLSRVKILENPGHSFTCGRTKTEFFQYNDVVNTSFTTNITHALWGMLSYFYCSASSYARAKTIRIRATYGRVLFWKTEGKNLRTKVFGYVWPRLKMTFSQIFVGAHHLSYREAICRMCGV